METPTNTDWQGSGFTVAKSHSLRQTQRTNVYEKCLHVHISATNPNILLYSVSQSKIHADQT